MSGQVPVVIVGAGPVGLVSALRLARNGVQSVVLEAADAFPIDLRASTFHPPTLDYLDELGVGETFVAMGEKAPTWQILDVETGRRAVFDLALIADKTRHPYRIQCEQYKRRGQASHRRYKARSRQGHPARIEGQQAAPRETA